MQLLFILNINEYVGIIHMYGIMLENHLLTDTFPVNILTILVRDQLVADVCI